MLSYSWQLLWSYFPERISKVKVQFIVTLIVLGLLGIIDTSYLIWKSRKKQPLVCPIGDACNVVLESRWNKIFFIRNDILGLLFYVGVIVGAILLFFEMDGIVKTLLIFGSGIGVLFSILLVFVQAKVIKNYCFYCLISAFLTLLIFLNVLLL